MLTMYPEGFGPLTLAVIKGKTKGKTCSDTCGVCLHTVTGKTAQESVKKLLEHIAVCQKYQASKN